MNIIKLLMPVAGLVAEKGKWCVYVLVYKGSTSNGLPLFYVGCTKRGKYRWYRSNYMYGRIGEVLRNVEKLTDAFDIVVVGNFDTKEDATKEEARLMQELNTLSPSRGFNIIARDPYLASFHNKKHVSAIKSVTIKPHKRAFVAQMCDGRSVRFSSIKQAVTTTGESVETIRRKVRHAKVIISAADWKK